MIWLNLVLNADFAAFEQNKEPFTHAEREMTVRIPHKKKDNEMGRAELVRRYLA